VAELVPIPFGQLLRRAHYEFERRRAIFDLPERKFYRRRGSADTLREGGPELDLSVSYAGARAANPVGPAAGPHTQLAQNIALCWLAGARIIELKTVQINDRLTLSEQPLHALHVALAQRWREVFGAGLQISFSAGVDVHNAATAMCSAPRMAAPIRTGSPRVAGGDGRECRRSLCLYDPPHPAGCAHATTPGKLRECRLRGVIA